MYIYIYIYTHAGRADSKDGEGSMKRSVPGRKTDQHPKTAEKPGAKKSPRRDSDTHLDPAVNHSHSSTDSRA